MAVAQVGKLKTSVPGQYLGYALQPVRLCFHLLDAPIGAEVSMELIDDVAVHYSQGELLLEQTKSALTGNPASDRSVELWKTFSNWADLCSAGKVNPHNTIFRYYVTPSGGGDLASRLHGATEKLAIDALLKEIDSTKIKGKPSSSAYPYIIRFLAAGEQICSQIIKSFELITEADPLKSIRDKFQAVLPPEVLDDFVKAAVGSAKLTIDQLIKNGDQPVVSAASFRSQFRAFVRKHNLASLLTPTTGAPSEVEIARIIALAPTFVRQLSAVDASKALLVTAVGDWMRTNADKIAWAADGIIVEESLDELDTSLERHHVLVADEVADTHANQCPKVQGRAIYRACTKLHTSLEGRELPTHFIPGAYNCLADGLRLGWHPDHKTLFPQN